MIKATESALDVSNLIDDGASRLYVNGGPALLRDDGPDQAGDMAQADLTTMWASAGSFSIGRGFADGLVERWAGEIDDVHAVPKVWSEAQVMTAAMTGADGQ